MGPRGQAQAGRGRRHPAAAKGRKGEPITVGSSQYSHARNKELIEQMIRGNGVLQVARIFFNDDDIDGAEPLSGHSNHIHVQFKLP
jgi:hypothetical protein